MSNWRVIIGGSALPRGLAAAAVDLGIDVFSGYGLSETCPVISLAQLDTDVMAGSLDEQLDYRCQRRPRRSL